MNSISPLHALPMPLLAHSTTVFVRGYRLAGWNKRDEIVVGLITALIFPGTWTKRIVHQQSFNKATAYFKLSPRTRLNCQPFIMSLQFTITQILFPSRSHGVKCEYERVVCWEGGFNEIKNKIKVKIVQIIALPWRRMKYTNHHSEFFFSPYFPRSLLVIHSFRRSSMQHTIRRT